MRERIELNGAWKFQPDSGGEGAAAGYPAADCDDRAWREAGVPSCFDFQHEGLRYYEGAAWYRRRVCVPAAWRGRRVVLRFEGVNQRARAWVNGEAVGENFDSYLPFEFEVSARLRFGAENVLAVCVDNTRRPEDVPGLERGWRTCGGILRDVLLEASDPLRLERVRVLAEPAGGRVNLSVRIHNGRGAPVAAGVAVELRDPAGAVCGRLRAGPVPVAAGGEAEAALEGTVSGAQSWSPETPVLYTAAVALETESGDAVDRAETRFGFRTIAAREGQLLLNGKPIRLFGFNRHEDAPATGLAKNTALARRDFLDMKRLGANFVRLCHYPHDAAELDLCDELGLLVMDEIPLYWWGWAEFADRFGGQCRPGLESADGGPAFAAKLGAARRALEKMIARDVNHPCVIFWSVSNETMDTHDAVIAGNAALMKAAKRLDPSRLAVHVSFRWHIRAAFDEDDVMCLNEYPSWGGRGCEANPGYEFKRSTEFWREGIARLHALYPGKPILVTEFGYPCLEGVTGAGLGEDMQARALEAEFEGMQAPWVCGATVWCYADHPWPGGGAGFWGLVTSPYGVVTRERRRKRGSDAAGRLFTAARGLPAGAGPAASNPPRLEEGVSMIREHLRDIPDAPFPAGFGIRPFRRGEEGLWLDIERDAERNIPIADDLFAQEFGHDPAGAERRCFFIVDGRGVAVGTISAWYSLDFRGRNCGRIHWVATRPAYQGRGLGRAGLSHALRALAQWHDQAWLLTSGERKSAIKMYLDFGFVPLIDSPRDREIWRLVQKTLAHPVLERCLG